MSTPSNPAPIRLGDVVPDFHARTQLGEFQFHEYINGKWAILFSHPKQSTPVCTTELGRAAQLKDEWAKRGCVVAAISTDSVKDNTSWISDINEIGKTSVEYPIIADETREISFRWGMLNQEHLDPDSGMPFNVRAVFFIGPDKKLKASILYPASTGRNFDEILRVLDSIQLTAKHSVATPADWQKGATCVVLPTIPTEEAKKLFPKGVEVVRPWLRTTPDPSV
jgi:alkyl hydroperoxide reductase subunit AhpC